MRTRIAWRGALLLAVLCVTCFLLGRFPQGFLKRRIEAAVSRSLGGRLVLDRLMVVPGTLTGEVQGLDLSTPSFSLRAAHVRVSLSWASLLGRGLVVRRLEVASPELRLTGVGPAPGGPGESPLPRIVVEEVLLTEGRLTGKEFDLEGIEARGGLGRGSLEVRLAGGSWGKKPPILLRPAQAHLRLSPTFSLEVDSFEGGTVRSSISGHGSLGPLLSPSPHLEFQGRLDLLDLATSGLPGPSAGELVVSGRVEGRQIVGQADGSGLVVSGVGVARTHLEVRATGEAATLSLTAGVAGGEVAAKGRWARGTLEGEARATDLELPPPARARVSAEVTVKGDPGARLGIAGGWSARAAPVAGVLLSATGRLSGGLTRSAVDLLWDAEARGEAPSYRVSGAVLHLRGSAQGVFPPEVDATFDGSLGLARDGSTEEVALEGFVRAGHGGTSGLLDASGLGGALHGELSPGGVLALHGHGLEIGRLVRGASGRADFSLGGSSVSAQGSVDVQGLGWNAMDLGTAHLDLQGDPRAGSFEGSLPGLQSFLRGTWTPRAIEGQVTLRDSRVPPHAGVSGSATGTVDFRAPLAALETTELRIELSALTLARGELSLQSLRPIALRTRGTDLTIDTLNLGAQGMSLVASGRLSPRALDLHLAGEVDTRALPLHGVRAAGTLRLDAQVRGSPSAPLAEGFVEGLGLSLSAPGRPTLELPKARLDLHGESVDLTDVHVAVGGGEVTLSGRVPWALPGGAHPSTRPPEGRLSIRWAGVEAARLGLGSLEGTLAGELALEGSPLAPRTLRGALRVPETLLGSGELAATLEPFEVRLSEGTATTDRVRLRAAEGSVEAHGSANLLTGQLVSSLTGVLDLRLLSPFLETASLGGTARVEVAVGGSLRDPRPSGRLEVTNGTLRARAFAQPVTSIQGVVAFEGDRARVESASGELGGGRIDVSGTARLSARRLSGLDLRLSGRDLGLRFPEGLRSRVDADLTLTGDPGRFLLKGGITADRGLYDLDLVLTQGLTTRAVAVQESPLLRSFALDLEVATRNPVRVWNNVAHLETEGSLAVRGDLQDPAPFGRLELQTGGTIYLQAQEFTITNGNLTFGGTFDPAVHVETQRPIRDAKSVLGKTNQDYLVTVGLEGSLSSPRLKLAAEPAELSEDQILSLIATGETAGAASASMLAGAQAASLLAGNLGRSLSQGLSHFGLGDISVRPELLARETDPGARFTFGKDLTNHVTLVYSLDLNDTQGRFVQLLGRPGLGLTFLAQRADDGTVTYGAGQTLHFGGLQPKATKPREDAFRPSEVRFEGDAPVDTPALLREARVKPGTAVTVWKLQEDADRLRDFLVGRGFLEAEVGGRTEGSTAIFRIHSGPHFVTRVVGMADPPDLGPLVRKTLFEDEALDRGRARVLEVLRRRGSLKATVDAEGKDEGKDRVLLFTATPGPSVPLKDVLFVGARALSGKSLLEAAGGPGGLLTTPGEAVRAVAKAYAAKGYLEAKVGSPEVSEEAGGLVVRVPVEEGHLAQVARVRFVGASLPAETLLPLSGIRPGTAAVDANLQDAAARIRALYLGKGYPQVRVVPSLAPSGHDLDVVFTVEEGARVVVGSVLVTGLTRTREGLVRRRIQIHPGDALDLRELAAAERRLLDLGVFDRVVVNASDENPTTVTVDLREGPWAVAGYDLRWDDVEHGTALVDGELRDIFGTGLALGGRYRIGSDVEEVRGSVHAASLGGVGDLTLSVFHIRRDFAAVDFFTQEPITNVQLQSGVRLFTTKRFAKSWSLELGYNHSRVESTLAPTPVGLGGLNVSLFSETRDNILDPQKGRFLSLSLDYDPSWLGSDFNFKKGLAQAFLIRPLSRSWIWAQGARLGLATGFGGFTTPVGSSGELESASAGNYLAGGADTLRGFATNGVGPQNFLGQYVGGDAVVVLNEEMRYRHPSGLGAAFFYDGGNVFDTVSHLNFSWRHDLGLGLRYASPVGLLRLDLGFPLNRAPGDRATRIFFSIGQIF